MARTLDGLAEFALLLGRNGGDARGDDLAALRDIALEQTGIFIIDARSILAGKGAGFAATENGRAMD